MKNFRNCVFLQSATRLRNGTDASAPPATPDPRSMPPRERVDTVRYPVTPSIRHEHTAARNYAITASRPIRPYRRHADGDRAVTPDYARATLTGHQVWTASHPMMTTGMAMVWHSSRADTVRVI